SGPQWAGAWVGYVADWTTKLLLATLQRFASVDWLSRATVWRDAIALLVAAVFVWLAVLASSASIEEHARRAPRRLLLSLLLCAVLVAMAVFQGGMPALPNASLEEWSVEQWATESLTVGLATLPALLAFAEWARLRVRGGIDPESGRRLGRRVRAGAPFILIPVAGIFSVLGGVIHAVAARSTGMAPRGLVASASGFGGALAGGAAVLLGLLLFFSLVPFVAVDAPLRAVASVGSRLGDRWLRWGTGLAIVLAAPLVRLFSPSAVMVFSGVALVPIVAVLMIDDGVIRRGRIHLEDLYFAPSRYAPLFGVGVAGVCALAVGWFVSIGRWDGIEWQGVSTDFPGLVNGFSYGGGSSVVVLAGTAAAVVYGLGRLLEKNAPLVPQPPLRAPGPERIDPAPSSIEIADWDGAPDEERASEPSIPDEINPRATGPLDPTVVELAEAQFSINDGDDEWPDERAEDGSEGPWYDDVEDMSNPSITAIGDPHFVKKPGDDE
ncbi:MAG: hypothetical protein AAFY60_03345, partial [Myxococcota bacterium]